MIHAKLTKLRVFPWNSARQPEQINRAQNISADDSLKQTKLYEIGRIDKLGVHKETPAVAYKMTQFEYGSLSFFRAIANKLDPASALVTDNVQHTDLQTSQFDITAYLTDDDGTFDGTLIVPNLRVNGFSIAIKDPDAVVERTFDIIGEDFLILKEKYLAYQDATVGVLGSGVTTQDVVLSLTAVEFASGKYIIKVLRVRSGAVVELEEDALQVLPDSFKYTVGTNTVTVQDVLAGDILKFYFASSTAYTTLWADNDSDSQALYADSVDVFMKVGSSEKIHQLQNVNIDVKFARTDYKEIGNPEVLQRGVKDTTVTVTLDRHTEGFRLEDILDADTAFPLIDPRDFSADIQLMVKIYADKTKQQFKMGYLINKLSPTMLGVNQVVEDYETAKDTLESDNIKISANESEIVFA